MLNSIESIESYLNNNYDRIKVYPYETVGEFAYDNPNGTFLVTMNGHISVIKSGHIIDTFDCSDREILSAWYVDKY